MQRSSSLLDFVSSLDDEITLPYLSMSVSVSHPGLDALGSVQRPQSPSGASYAQPDGDVRRRSPPLRLRPGAPFERRKARSAGLAADAADADVGVCARGEDPAEAANEVPPCSRSLGGLRLTYPHSLADLASPNSALTVDYTLARERGIKFTLSQRKLRVRKRTLLWLLLTQISMVVGLVSRASTFTSGWHALGGLRAAPGARAPSVAPAAIRMVASMPGHGPSRRPFGPARGGGGGAGAYGGGGGGRARVRAPENVVQPGSAGSGPRAFSAFSAPSAHPVVRVAASAVGAFAGSLDAAVERSREVADSLTLDSARASLARLDWLRVSQDFDRAKSSVSSVSSICYEYVHAQVELLELAREALLPPADAAAHWWAPGMPAVADALVKVAAAAPPAVAPAAETANDVADAPARAARERKAATAAASATASAGTMPAGFERELAVQFAHLCGISYHCALEPDAPSPTTAADTARISAELEEIGLELVETFRDKQMDTFAFLAGEKVSHVNDDGAAGAAAGEGARAPSRARDAPRGARRLFLIFRGSVSSLNKELNFDIFRCGYDAADDCFAHELAAGGAAARTMPSWVRAGAMPPNPNGAPQRSAPAGGADPCARAYSHPSSGLVEAREGAAGRDVELHVSGHSLGGAMAMLASAEIAHLARHFERAKSPPPAALAHLPAGASALFESLGALGGGGGRPRARGKLVAHKLYTFAAPRIGNEAFAAHFARAFCSGDSYWAVQSGGDAVPHLPLQAMGFHHPPGRIVTLNKYGRVGVHLDTGDDRLHAWVPRGFNPENWVRTHDIISYGSELQGLVAQRP
ncbi:hypothetical protein KFE25_002820 [Diacronema lutheri]|uniref:Fungal lipase-type domain-containing protein n=2 Tax=Diacronema lutheri TaxID=2081491 RepID=A0A8J5XEK6_DIALT|nr:hypothetical protein KFE25_002820 [Diacronema lutheri]